MGVKVYVSGISGNKEVKKRQQRVFMILESKNIPFSVVDITEPGKEEEKDFMQTNSKSLGVTVSDTTPRHPLPPQIFNDSEYCGDYDQFDLANEIDILEQFLKVEISNPVQNNVNDTNEAITQKVNEVIQNLDESVERIETNGVASSREASIESDKKSNGAEQPQAEVEEEEEADEVEEVDDVDVQKENNSNDLSELKKDATASGDFIQNEQAAEE